MSKQQEKYEPQIGHSVKISDEATYTGTWIIEDIQDGKASLYQTRRWQDKRTKSDVDLARLIHVCNRSMYSNYESRTCGKPVKEGNLCGLHASVDRRAEERREQERRDFAAREVARQDKLAQIRDAQATLKSLGLETLFSTNFDVRDGRVLVTLDLEDVVNLLDA